MSISQYGHRLQNCGWRMSMNTPKRIWYECLWPSGQWLFIVYIDPDDLARGQCEWCVHGRSTRRMSISQYVHRLQNCEWRMSMNTPKRIWYACLWPSGSHACMSMTIRSMILPCAGWHCVHRHTSETKRLGFRNRVWLSGWVAMPAADGQGLPTDPKGWLPL